MTGPTLQSATITAQAADLASLTNVKEWLGISNATDDRMLARLISSCSSMAYQFMNRAALLSASYTETRDGNDSQRMVTRNYPITAVASVTIYTPAFPWGYGQLAQGNNTPPSVIPLSPDGAQYQPGYAFDADTIILAGYRFARGRDNVIISYTAGFAVIPWDIEQAVIEWVSDRYRMRSRIGEKSKALPQGGSQSYDMSAIPDRVQAVLFNYKRVVPV
jgi:hypothetical protein